MKGGSRRSAARLLGAAALGALLWWLPRGALRIRQGLRRYNAASARLATSWSTIPGVTGFAPLRLHARFADGAATPLPPIVLVQGYGIGGRYLAPLAAHLADQARVFIPDLPGHGHSDHDARPQTIVQLAGSLAAWMDANGLRASVLVGHSLGCQVAAELAVRRPELVSGLVLLAPTLDPSARNLARLVPRALATAVFERSDVFLWLVRDYSRAGIGLLLTEFQAMLAHRIEDRLPSVAVPLRVVRGSRDRMVPHRWAEVVAVLGGGPPAGVIHRSAHALHYDAPERVAAVVACLAEEAARCTGPAGASRDGGVAVR
jgi:pimeloyl-ACP methyl ester carboxylesterase